MGEIGVIITSITAAVNYLFRSNDNVVKNTLLYFGASGARYHLLNKEATI